MPEEKPAVQVEEEPKDTSQEKVDVTPLPTLTEEEQLAAKIKADFEQLYGGRLKQVNEQFENFRHGAYRIQDDLRKENERLKTQLTSVQQPVPASSTKDFWATVENGSVAKEEVARLADERFKQKMEAWQQEQQAQNAFQQQHATQEASKQRVIAKYPDLDPDTGITDSLVAQTYLKTLNAHQDWLTNPYGPELAMYAMEETLKAAAPQTPKGSKVAAASLGPSRSLPATGERYTLTREQKAFCDRHQIKYEEFLKNAAALEQGAVEA